MQVVVSYEMVVNDRGKFCVSTYRLEQGEQKKSVLLLPEFGRTSKSYFDLIYCLVCNGFKVNCIDYQNHVGKGTGSIENSTLTLQMLDVKKALEAIDVDILISDGVAIWPAIRALIQNKMDVKAILMNPVYDLKDEIATQQDGLSINGYKIGHKFINDVKVENYTHIYEAILESMKNNLAVTVITRKVIAQKIESYIKNNQLNYRMNNLNIVKISNNEGNIGRNPVIAMKYYFAVNDACKEYCAMNQQNYVPTYMEIIKESDQIKEI